MAFPRARRLPLLLCAAGVAALAGEGRARADKNDLQLINLCPTVDNPDTNLPECGWVKRTPTGQRRQESRSTPTHSRVSAA